MTKEEEIKALSLNSGERDTLDNIGRFFTNIYDPKIARQARAVGFDGAEYAIGRALFATATGQVALFDTLVSGADNALLNGSNETRVAIKTLDTFENTWWERTLAVLKRYVPAKRRDAVIKAFFDGIPQQAEGPAVVNNVATFLNRFHQLATSDEPGAKQAHDALVRRGLTVNFVQQTRDQLEELATPPDVKTYSVDDRLTAARERREAYEELKLWYQDWATTLRGELGYHDLVRLGLREVKGGRRASADEPVEEAKPAVIDAA